MKHTVLQTYLYTYTIGEKSEWFDIPPTREDIKKLGDRLKADPDNSRETEWTVEAFNLERDEGFTVYREVWNLLEQEWEPVLRKWDNFTLWDGVWEHELDIRSEPEDYLQAMRQFRSEGGMSQFFFADPMPWQDPDPDEQYEWGPEVEDIDWTGIEEDS